MPFARGGLGHAPPPLPRKFLNLEVLKYHYWRSNTNYWCSNTTISVNFFSNLINFLAVSSIFQDIRVKYSAFCFLYENLMKISQHESKSGFFLSRLHIGWDSGFSSKIGIVPMKSGWLDSQEQFRRLLLFI